MHRSLSRRFQSELLSVSKAVKSPPYRHDSEGGGGEAGGKTAKSPRAPETRDGDGGGEWGFASAFLFALSLVTTVGKRNGALCLADL